MRSGPTLAVVAALFAVALAINLQVLPGSHIVSSLYLLPVLVACHRLGTRSVVVAAGVAIGFYLLSAAIKGRPLAVWPFGVFALLIGGYLTIRFAAHRQAIARHAREMEAARQRLQMFLGMIAHDLAGALTNVLAGVELLGQTGGRPASATERGAALAVEGAARQMQRLLDDLRDVAAIGAGRFEMRPAPMDLVAITRLVVDQQRLSAHRHRLILDAPEGLEGTWDSERIGQLLTNLVSNAVKYSPQGGEVRVVVRRDADGAVVSVRDRGVGISPEQRSLLFQPFARIESSSDVPGTGLGLWIVKAIVEAHGGRVWVESAVGQGSTFSVGLPGGEGPSGRAGRPDAGAEPRWRWTAPAVPQAERPRAASVA